MSNASSVYSASNAYNVLYVAVKHNVLSIIIAFILLSSIPHIPSFSSHQFLSSVCVCVCVCEWCVCRWMTCLDDSITRELIWKFSVHDSVATKPETHMKIQSESSNNNLACELNKYVTPYIWTSSYIVYLSSFTHSSAVVGQMIRFRCSYESTDQISLQLWLKWSDCSAVPRLTHVWPNLGWFTMLCLFLGSVLVFWLRWYVLIIDQIECAPLQVATWTTAKWELPHISYWTSTSDILVRKHNFQHNVVFLWIRRKRRTFSTTFFEFSCASQSAWTAAYSIRTSPLAHMIKCLRRPHWHRCQTRGQNGVLVPKIKIECLMGRLCPESQKK
jgi:hypothetical protein